MTQPFDEGNIFEAVIGAISVGLGFIPQAHDLVPLTVLAGEVGFLEVIAPGLGVRLAVQRFGRSRFYVRLFDAADIRACRKLAHVIVDKAQVRILRLEDPQTALHFGVIGKQDHLLTCAFEVHRQLTAFERNARQKIVHVGVGVVEREIPVGRRVDVTWLIRGDERERHRITAHIAENFFVRHDGGARFDIRCAPEQFAGEAFLLFP